MFIYASRVNAIAAIAPERQWSNSHLTIATTITERSRLRRAPSSLLYFQARAKFTSHQRSPLELELELIQSHMAQSQCCGVKWGARALRVRSVSREEVWASAGVRPRRLGGWVWV